MRVVSRQARSAAQLAFAEALTFSRRWRLVLAPFYLGVSILGDLRLPANKACAMLF